MNIAARKLLEKSVINSYKYKLPYDCVRYVSSIKESVQISDQKPIQQIHRRIESFGQPTSFTHSHLLQSDELIQGVTATEIQNRRNQLLDNIQAYSQNVYKKSAMHVVVIPSASKKYISDKIPYVFRQNTDFLYLSGCLEPDSVLVLVIDSSNNKKSILFVRPKDKHSELWDGPRTGVENATNFFLVDEAYDVSNLSNILKKFGQIDFLWHDNKSEQQSITETVKLLSSDTTSKRLDSPTAFIHKQRLFKSQSEIKLMRKTCQIASECINKTMKKSKPGDSEHNIFARIDYYCRMNGASYLAYPPVVASGRNATIIHYINNSQIVNKGDLVLMDAGCEYGGYTSDITRTWPISGTFTQPQKILYEIIYTVQKELINILLKDGGLTLDALFDTMCLRLGGYLQEIGLVPKGLSGIELAKSAYSFCPHHVSHYLGMDVHDTSTISRSIYLKPGMVCTVEPGIYIASDRKDVPEEFRGIGIRIEDDILITSDSTVEVLTDKSIKDPNLLSKYLCG